ncbi:membrane-associated protein [Paucimonas lemoignei]|uniref:Membrane-associated protein n=1 Tax=Paucimonas lemoignei TaxID=29443 RepID=A0A4R3I044_PAULE|nr:DedA family protein [Paucimonas lemoignei]TCS38333.1 membrane-associated protein [Paucimonas lemoignei]
MIEQLVSLILHVDMHLLELLQNYGPWIYAILFLIIFVETGLVVMPFLPGDSLLFVIGALAAAGGLSLPLIIVLLIIAAIAGDTVNFATGAWFHRKTLAGKRYRWPNPEHLRITHEFFERHGGKTIIIARFVPIVRTLAPFVAGIGQMHYARFALYNVTGAILWVVSLTVAGYLLGNVPWVKANLTAVLMGLIVLSLLPGIIGWLNSKRSARP